MSLHDRYPAGPDALAPGEKRHEYSENLWITTGVPGNAQESSFINATLQSTGSTVSRLEFSVATHVAIPSSVRSEESLREYLFQVFGVAIGETNKIFGSGTLNVEIQLGPEGSGEGADSQR